MKMEKPAQGKRVPTTHWIGALEGLHRNLLFGWAVDSTRPEARVVLEVCLNDEAVGCVIADVARTDLTDRFAGLFPPGTEPDPCHGFVADLGANAEQRDGVLTVRFANTDVLLAGKIDRQIDPLKPPVAATSMVFGDASLRLHGWAIDARDEKRVVQVSVYEGNEFIASASASLTHPALRRYNVRAHGFDLSLPLSLADGRVHELRVVDQAGNALNGSPVKVCCLADGAKTLLPAVDAQDVLGSVIEAYERYLPRSIGFEHYRAWSARFDDAPPDAPPPPLRVGILITGEANKEARARTLTSLQVQCGITPQVFGTKAKGRAAMSFAAQLTQALGSDCDVLGCIRAGDTLTPHALAYALQGFAVPGAELVYTDSEQGNTPWFKPAWNPEYALGSDYPLELMLTRMDVLRALERDGALPDNAAELGWRQLTAVWTRASAAIIHVPRVLYRFQSALSASEQQERYSAAADALRALEPKAVLTPLTNTPPNAGFSARRVQRPLGARERRPSVSLIIPTRDHIDMLKRCIESIRTFTDWPQLQIIVIDNGSVEARSKTYFRSLAKQGVTVMPMPGPFNFASINNRAVDAAEGTIIGLINNDIEALHAGWLDELVGQLLRPGVGAVGAKLVWQNGMVQHGGVLLGVGNVAGHFGNRLSDGDWGDAGRNQLVQQVSGVTAACLLMRKSDYQALGGMDPDAFPVAFNDVDLCLKLRRAGKAIVWTPYARLLHAESASRGHEDTPQKQVRAQRELHQLRQRWGAVLLRDPAYHPSLNLDAHSQAFGGLALPPRARTPRTNSLLPPDEV